MTKQELTLNERISNLTRDYFGIPKLSTRHLIGIKERVNNDYSDYAIRQQIKEYYNNFIERIR